MFWINHVGFTGKLAGLIILKAIKIYFQYIDQDKGESNKLKRTKGLPFPDKRIFLCFQIFIIMYRFFFRFVVTALTILTANLLTNAISGYMITYKNHLRPITFTFIAMAIILVVFYPLFMKMEDWLKIISVKVIRSGNSIAGKYLGLAFAFLCGLMVLFYFYAKMWYHIDFLQVLLHGNIGGYL